MRSSNGTTPYPIQQLGPKDFPALLKEIPDAPSLLYVRGALPPPERKLLCVVGSRACSAYGRRQTHRLITGLAGCDVAIVSGLALGIDGEAHQAALDAGLPTVAVLPSSVDDASIYPSAHRALAGRILSSGGALVSEYPAPHRPQVYDFPARNRIGAGLSHATLIVEAAEKSGTLITARLALEYNREVLAVPHELEREGGAGTNALIRQGATLVQSSADILQALGIAAEEPAQQLPLPNDLTDDELRVMRSLSRALERDELVEYSGLSAQRANVALSSLLIRGLIAEKLGKVERAR